MNSPMTNDKKASPLAPLAALRSGSSLITFITLFFFLLGPAGLRPARAAVPLAVLAPAVLGAAVLAAGAGSYYAPAVYDAANSAVSTTGKIAHKMYLAQEIGTAVGSYMVGKTVTGVLDLGADAGAWIQSKASSLPALWGSISPHYTPAGPPVPPSYPALGDVWVMPGINTSSSPWTQSGTYKRIVSGTPNLVDEGTSGCYYIPPGGSGWYWVTNLSKVRYFQFTTQTGCSSGRWMVHFYSFYTTASSTAPETDYGDGTIIFPAWGGAFTPSPDISNDIMSGLGMDDAPRAFYDTDEPTLGAVGAPPAVIPLGNYSPTAPYDAIKDHILGGGATAIKDIADANPTDPVLAVESIKADVLAQAGALESAKEQAAEAAETYPAAPSGVVPASPSLLEIDWTPIQGLGNTLANKIPFSLVTNALGVIETFSGEPQTPSISFSLLPGQSSPFVISMAAWDTAAQWWRGLLAILFHTSVVYVISRRWIYG